MKSGHEGRTVHRPKYESYMAVWGVVPRTGWYLPFYGGARR